MKLEVIGSGSPEVLWPAPIEPIWNSIGQTNSLNRILKRPDIGLSHRLLIASILNLPTSQRPWGIVTWLSDFYDTSRQTLYSIADSILAPCQVDLPNDQPLGADDQSLPNHGQSEPPAPDCQVERAILSMARKFCFDTPHARNLD